jgi:hypothetical protein
VLYRRRITSAYFFVWLASAAISLSIIWAWVLFLPMTYLDGTYPQWLQRATWLRECELADVVVLGDSKVESAIIPRNMPVATLNLGGPGGGPFETAYIADQIARCPDRPRRVLLSLSTPIRKYGDVFRNRIFRRGATLPC